MYVFDYKINLICFLERDSRDRYVTLPSLSDLVAFQSRRVDQLHAASTYGLHM